MTDTSLTMAPAGPAIDLDRLDGTLSNLHRASRLINRITVDLAEARARVVVAPDDVDAARAVRMASLQMRANAAELAGQFAILAQVGEAPL